MIAASNNDEVITIPEFKKEEQQALRIDTADIQQRFNCLYSEIKTINVDISMK